MIAPVSQIVLVSAPELTEAELRDALELFNRDELQKIIQVVYATAGGLQ